MKKITVAYQGIHGAYSQLVLAHYLSQFDLDYDAVGVPTYRQVATSVISGKADVGVLPIDNAIMGTIRDGYDLLAQYDLIPIAEVEWRMDHRLLGYGNHALSEIREVYGHPVVLGECGKFLGTLVGAIVIPSEDTGVAAKQVADAKDPGKAVIGPEEAAKRYGLVELAGNIADHPQNFTRFLLFHSQNAAEDVLVLGGHSAMANRKTSLLLSVSHEKGALAKCLNIFSEKDINLSKLESHPKPGKAWEYDFYIDFEGDIREDRTQDAIARIRAYCANLKIIGSYDTRRATIESDAARNYLTREPFEPFHEWTPELLPSSAAGWPKVSRQFRPQGTIVSVGGVTVGDGFTVIAGPCSVESRDQILESARAVKAKGAHMLRGGAFKPRTNPYSFQGLGWEGVSLLAEAGRAVGLPTVSEVMSVDQVERIAREIDVLQIGARNMQNFDLLRAVGQTDRVVLLKRGMSASSDELLAAAEYIVASGNPNVILCERGIRTFETATRFTLDLNIVPVLKERSHLPVIVDPSHGVGVRRWIRPLCRAAKAVGADGIILEVHPNPATAKSDKDQALTFDDFAIIMGDLDRVPYDYSP